jgi:hypothetical protein
MPENDSVAASAASSATCQPPPNVTKPWPIGVIYCTPSSSDGIRNDNGTLILKIEINFPAGLIPNEEVTLALFYTVNGSPDYSALLSQTEVNRHSTVTFEKGQAQASVTIHTLPIPPNTTFELEVLAYPAAAGTIISGPVRAQADAEDAGADDKSLKALNVLATTALVTALGALAFALLRTRD